MESLIELLAKIPLEASSAIVQGVEMQVIDHETWQEMLHSDPGRKQYHECLMANGFFIITKKNGSLQSLYKVKDSPAMKCSGTLSVNHFFPE